MIFHVTFEQAEDGWIVAECPALPGCHVQGETYEEALAEMRAAIDAFLEDYIASSEEIPEDEVTVTSLKVAV